jgi:hypothetical protein
MWYLIITLAGSNGNGVAAVVIPDKYPTEQACKDAGRYTSSSKCIPAPQIKLADDNRYERAKIEYCLIHPDGSLAKEICTPDMYPGYYCGQHPEKCKIKE